MDNLNDFADIEDIEIIDDVPVKPKAALVSLGKVCPVCGSRHVLRFLDRRLYDSYLKEGYTLDQVFPTLNKTEKEFIETGTCLECQKKGTRRKVESDMIF